MACVGCYCGVVWKRQRIGDVLCVTSKAYWYFLYDGAGQPTGDHFRTLHTLRVYLDNLGRLDA